MPDRDEIDIATFDYRALTLDQINELKSAAFRRAHEARADAWRLFFRRAGAALNWLWAFPGRAWARYRLHRRWRADIAVLRKMNDRALKDMGLTRVDVEALAHRRRD
jgi:uncharacterized protein YjiS (DUF1127 family)